jgi:hypothetical protein
MNGVFKSARFELFLVVDDHHRILVVVGVLETRYTDGSLSPSVRIDVALADTLY